LLIAAELLEGVLTNGIPYKTVFEGFPKDGKIIEADYSPSDSVITLWVESEEFEESSDWDNAPLLRLLASNITPVT